jgi:Flp pilus assembly CpaE family ATPase
MPQLHARLLGIFDLGTDKHFGVSYLVNFLTESTAVMWMVTSSLMGLRRNLLHRRHC